MATRKKKNISGLGDVIASVTEAVGVKPCEGCNSRKDLLNVLFPFHRARPLTEAEYNRYGEIKSKEEKSREEMLEIYELYNSAFDTHLSYCGKDCGTTVNVLKRLNKLYDNYEPVLKTED